MKTPYLDKLDEINSMHEDAGIEEQKLLTERGWEYTSDTPGSVWLWEKKLADGRTLLVNTDTALTLETELCGEYRDQDVG